MLLKPFLPSVPVEAVTKSGLHNFLHHQRPCEFRWASMYLSMILFLTCNAITRFHSTLESWFFLFLFSWTFQKGNTKYYNSENRLILEYHTLDFLFFFFPFYLPSISFFVSLLCFFRLLPFCFFFKQSNLGRFISLQTYIVNFMGLHSLKPSHDKNYHMITYKICENTWLV